ncbi:hypothetical protein ACJX0J_014159, partial [Zea mays]
MRNGQSIELVPKLIIKTFYAIWYDHGHGHANLVKITLIIWLETREGTKEKGGNGPIKKYIFNMFIWFFIWHYLLPVLLFASCKLQIPASCTNNIIDCERIERKNRGNGHPITCSFPSSHTTLLLQDNLQELLSVLN